MSTNDGGPAFPQITYQVENGHWEGRYEIDKQVHGMSLRDYFAGQVLSAVMVNATGDFTPDGLQKACSFCYIFADGMLAAREAKP